MLSNQKIITNLADKEALKMLIVVTDNIVIVLTTSLMLIL